MNNEAVAKIVKGINQWMAYVRAEGDIADIDDALGEYSDAMKRAGVTRDEVYVAFRKQFA